MNFLVISRSIIKPMWLCLVVSTVLSAGKPPAINYTVYVFLNTECPISQQYSPSLTALHKQFGHSGIRFIAVIPLRTDSPAVIRTFQKTYILPFATLPDANARLAHQFRALVTPEVVVVQADGRVRYQGAIDDWYVALGKHRPQPRQHYLRDALNSLLAGHDVLTPRTEAVGCLIE